MADDTTARGPQDSSRIAMGEDYEFQYWTKRFGVTREDLQRAVDAVGSSADAVERHLKGWTAGSAERTRREKVQVA